MKKITAGHASILLGLVLSLTGCGYESTTEAIAAWKAQGKTEKIIELIYDPVQATRVEGIQALGDIQAKEALEPLVGLFNDPDKIVVHEAIDAVVKIGGPEIEPHMLEAITLDTVPARVAGATALGTFKSPEAVDALIVALDDYKYEQVVLAAIASLGEIGDPRAVDPLCIKLKERAYNIREACIASLFLIGDDAALRGISTRLGDVSEPIRDATRAALKESGAQSTPFALEALRSESYLARAGALDVLNGLDVVPDSGSDLVWYRLAELTPEENAAVDPVKAEVFAAVEDPIPGLLEALMHTTPAFREYASVALENRGEPAVEATVAFAEENATEAGLAWFNKRSEWSGAPSWRIDLWGASVALNPKFKINQAFVKLLAQGGSKAEKVMSAQQFRPRREILPYLVFRLTGPGSKDKDKIKETERCRSLAMKTLVGTGYQAVFPLVAALQAEDAEIATHSALVLNKIGGARVEAIVVAECVKQFEAAAEPLPEEIIEAEEGLEDEETVATEEAVVDETADAEETPVPVRRNPGNVLSGTSLHNAMLELEIPALQPMIKKIRPDEVAAIRDFKGKYPGMTVISLPLNVDVDPARNAVLFRLSYYKNEQMNELKVIYRLNGANEWAINPPLPDELP